MSSKTIRPLRVLALVAVLAAFLALPAFASATTYSMKWGHVGAAAEPERRRGLRLGRLRAGRRPAARRCCVSPATSRGDVFVTDASGQAAAQWHRAEHRHRKLAHHRRLLPVGDSSASRSTPLGQVMHSTHPLGGRHGLDQAGAGRQGDRRPAAATPASAAISLPDDHPLRGGRQLGQRPGRLHHRPDRSGQRLDAHHDRHRRDARLGLLRLGHALRDRRQPGLLQRPTPPAAPPPGRRRGAQRQRLGDRVARLQHDQALRRRRLRQRRRRALRSAPRRRRPPPGRRRADRLRPARAERAGAWTASPARSATSAWRSTARPTHYTSSTPVRGDWSAARPLKKKSQATLSQVACNAKLCVEVDNRGTVTYGVVKGADDDDQDDHARPPRQPAPRRPRRPAPRRPRRRPAPVDATGAAERLRPVSCGA